MAPPFYQGELGYNPGFDADEKPLTGPNGEALPAELKFLHKYKRRRRINIFGLIVRATQT